MPDWVSARIGEILEILGAIRRAQPRSLEELGEVRRRASNDIAAAHRIGFNSVADKYQRQLNVGGTAAFERLVWAWLQHGDPQLMDAMIARVSADSAAADRAAIERFFGAGAAAGVVGSTPDRSETARTWEMPPLSRAAAGDERRLSATLVSATELERVSALAEALLREIDGKLRLGLAGVSADQCFQWAVLKAAAGDRESMSRLLKGQGLQDGAGCSIAALLAVTDLAY